MSVLPFLLMLACQVHDEEEEGPPTADIIRMKGVAAWAFFPHGLRIKNELGTMWDFRFGFNPEDIDPVGFSVGYAHWKTENDEDKLPPASVYVDQLRLGVGRDWDYGAFEVGIWSAAGCYLFRREGERDVSLSLDLELSIGISPCPAVKLGVIGTATFTRTSFNRHHTDSSFLFSAGPGVEIRF